MEMVKHMKNLLDFSKKELFDIINLAIDIKKNPSDYSTKLGNQTLIMWFEKQSLRTRVSFESGMTQLGGHAIYLDQKTVHNKAKLSDEVKCLEKYGDIITARVFEHETIEIFAKNSKVPVINALCDKFHPCQALADFLTIFETVGFDGSITLAYVGDGNNVCNSFLLCF